MPLGITNQRETTIVWDRETGKPVYNAIVWQDRRTAALRKTRQEGAEPTSPRARPACSSTPISPAPRSRWILDNVTGARARPKPASSPSAPWIAGSSGI